MLSRLARGNLINQKQRALIHSSARSQFTSPIQFVVVASMGFLLADKLNPSANYLGETQEEKDWEAKRAAIRKEQAKQEAASHHHHH